MSETAEKWQKQRAQSHACVWLRSDPMQGEQRRRTWPGTTKEQRVAILGRIQRRYVLVPWPMSCGPWHLETSIPTDQTYAVSAFNAERNERRGRFEKRRVQCAATPNLFVLGPPVRLSFSGEARTSTSARGSVKARRNGASALRRKYPGARPSWRAQQQHPRCHRQHTGQRTDRCVDGPILSWQPLPC
jgi:hypothetical protein